MYKLKCLTSLMNVQLHWHTFRLNISDYIQSKEHIQLARDMATQTMVLLKNNQFENNGLPITSPYMKACVSNQYNPHKVTV